MSHRDDPVPTARGKLPLIGHSLAMAVRKQRFMRDLAVQGDLVRLQLGRRPAYYVHSAELLRQMLVTDARKVGKGWVYDRVRNLIGNGLVTADGPVHTKHRRMMQPAFRRSCISAYAGVMTEEAVALAGSWRPAERVAVGDAVALLSGIVIARSLCSSRHLTTATAHRLALLSNTVIKTMSVRVMLPESVWERLPLPSTRRTTARIKEFHAIVDELIAHYRADDEIHDDLLSTLLTARDEDTGTTMTNAQIHDEITTLFVAGVETTSAALSGAFYELARNPEVERQILREIDEVLAGREPSFADLPKLAYTRRFLNEVLRRYSIWFLMRQATDDLQWGPHHIPCGTALIFSPFSLHHDERFYPDADRIDPDRWLDDDHLKSAFVPFSSGPRGCIGESFAWAEMMITLATVLRTWRLELPEDSKVRLVTSGTLRAEPLTMVAVPR